LQSIAMSVSVCVSVCEDIPGNTSTIFTKLFVDVAYGAGFKVRTAARPPSTIELFQIIPVHMMNRELILGRKKRVRRCRL